MTPGRVDRIKRQLLREATLIIKEELKDPRVGFITVTAAEVTADLHNAKIYVSILGTPEEQKETFRALTHAAGFMRTQIGKRMQLRRTPEILFVRDDSLERVDRITRILNTLKTKESSHDIRSS